MQVSKLDLGGMSKTPLLISQIIERAASLYGEQEIADGTVHRYNYATALQRTKQLAKVLLRLGVVHQQRIGTLAYSTYRHFELYYAVPGLGAILNTVNPRLIEREIIYIINHSEDKILFFDPEFLPLVERIYTEIQAQVRHLVVLGPRTQINSTSQLSGKLLYYEELLQVEQDLENFVWPQFDETSSSILCYTSGTTGNPKGVLYEHRSTWLHCMNVSAPNYYNISSHSCVMGIAPMYHSSGWWLSYICPLNGAKLVLPGAKLDSKNLYDLIQHENVDSATAVPTIWIAMMQFLDQGGLKFSNFKKIISSGTAFPRALIESYLAKHGVSVFQIYGSTEINVGTYTQIKSQEVRLPTSKILDLTATAGRQVHLVETRIVDDKGNVLPHDGKSVGHIQTRGQNILRAYYKFEGQQNFTKDGWFDTGDVGVFDQAGNLKLTDRTKDLIKSGGEWISSIDLENCVMAHPSVKEAAVVAVPHPKWEERPLLVVSVKPNMKLEKLEILDFFNGKIAKWQIPDDVCIVADLPHGPTGKILKKELREQYKNYVLPTAKL